MRRCSGGKPFASPLSMSSLCAISWMTTLCPGGCPLPSTSAHDRITGPRPHASPDNTASDWWTTPASSVCERRGMKAVGYTMMLCQPSYQSSPSFRIGRHACVASKTRSPSSSSTPSTGSMDLRSRNSVASTRSVAWSEAPSRRAGAQRCSALRQRSSAIGRRATTRRSRQFRMSLNMDAASVFDQTLMASAPCFCKPGHGSPHPGGLGRGWSHVWWWECDAERPPRDAWLVPLQPMVSRSWRRLASPA